MRRFGLLALGALLLALFALTVERVAERGRFATEYSTYGSGPQGSRALYLLVQQLAGANAAPQRWAQDLARLPPRTVLVALGGCDTELARPVSRYERQELVRWVQSGGVLLVAGVRDYLPQAFGVHFMSEPACEGTLAADHDAGTPERESESWRERAVAADGGQSDSGVSSEPASAASESGEDDRASGGPHGLDDLAGSPPAQLAHPPGPGAAADAGPAELAAADLLSEPSLPPDDTTWAIPMAPALRGLRGVPFREAGELIVVPDQKSEILLGVPRGAAAGAEREVAPLAVVLRHGLGHVIVLASASMLQNRELGPSDGGAMFLRLLRAYAPDMPVLFDEYHLGIGERRSLMLYLRQMGAAPLVLQLLLVFAVFLWRAGARFGAVERPAATPPAGTSSFVAGLGRLYERTGDPAGALELIARDAYGRIAAHHHLETGPPERLTRALIDHGFPDAASAVREIETAASSGKDPAAKLPALTQRIDAALARALAQPNERRGA